MIATVAATNANLAQILFLIGFILAVIATVVAAMEKGWVLALGMAAVACVSFGLLFST